VLIVVVRLDAVVLIVVVRLAVEESLLARSLANLVCYNNA